MNEEAKITNNDLQGTWEYSHGHSDKIKYIFTGNKIDFYTNDNFHFGATFTINGSNLIITFSDGSSSSDTEISLSGNSLTIINARHKTNATYKRRTSSSRSGCYIATAVYGSYDCPQVWSLRRYRDNTLANNIIGRVFISIYYSISPIIVKVFGKSGWFLKFCRRRLDKFVYKLEKNEYKNTFYKDGEKIV
jgi:hypothetical protein